MSEGRRYTAGELVSEQHEFVKCGDHLSDSVWYATFKLVVCHNNNRGGRISNVERDGAIKTVVIYNNSIERLVKELRREFSFKIIVSDIKIAECRQFDHDCRKASNETVIAHIKLMK